MAADEAPSPPPGAAGFQVQSVADQVYAVLRERIATGEIERGSRLHQEDLASEGLRGERQLDAVAQRIAVLVAGVRVGAVA